MWLSAFDGSYGGSGVGEGGSGDNDDDNDIGGC